MRRISAAQATPGMVLLRSIYDSRGYIILKEGSRLSQESLKTLNIYRVSELVIEDRRVSDVPVQQLIAPELEAEAVQALRQLLTEHQGNTSVDPHLLQQAGPSRLKPFDINLAESEYQDTLVVEVVS